jgi:hypothetical protein
MGRVRTMAARAEARTARLAAWFSPLAKLPARYRAALLQGAAAVLLLALGVVIGKQLAWILIAVAITVIVLVGLAGFLASAAGPAATAKPTIRVPFEKPASPTDSDEVLLKVVKNRQEKHRQTANASLREALAAELKFARGLKANFADSLNQADVAVRAVFGTPRATSKQDIDEFERRVKSLLRDRPDLWQRFCYVKPRAHVPATVHPAIAPLRQVLQLDERARLAARIAQLELILDNDL